MLSVCFGLSLPSTLQGALLPISFVAEQVSKSAGRGNYQLSQSVEFRVGEEAVMRIRENWFLGANSVLQAEVRSASGEQRGLIYAQFRDQQLLQTNIISSVQRTARLRHPHALWMIRSSSQWMAELRSLGLLQGYQPETRVVANLKDIQYPMSPYASLKRQARTVMIALAESAGSFDHFVGVDQDHFVVVAAAVRLPRPHQWTASEVSEYAAGLKLPSTREITWPQLSGVRSVSSAFVRVLEVKDLGRQASPPNSPTWSQRNFDWTSVSSVEAALLEAYFF